MDVIKHKTASEYLNNTTRHKYTEIITSVVAVEGFPTKMMLLLTRDGVDSDECSVYGDGVTDCACHDSSVTTVYYRVNYMG